MPPGTPHHSFLLPYRIRVDDFASPRDVKEHFDPPALYLLSHTHSDHITGLSAKSFAARVVCSADAKHMLLNYESAGDRIAFDMGDATEKRRPYSHLKIDHKTSVNSKHKMFGRDLLRALPLNSPTTLELSDDVTVTLTLVDANHCPGAVMFLVEGPLGNFLHTGDFRADHHFLESLARNPWLQRYILPPITFHDLADESGETPLRTLDAIHLDTASLLSHHALPSKEDACVGLVKLIALFPPLTRFFINSWTWGYEDILKALGRAFNSKIHVDRYKFGIYSGISDPSLRSLLTLDADATRFHACERMNRCEQVTHGIAQVVYVNPMTLSKAKWDKYFQETQASLQRGEHVSSLLCPLSRHSSLPELQAFVKLFKPKLVVPNSLNPDWTNLDWACMPRMFGDCLADGGEASMHVNMRGANLDIDYLDYVAPGDDVGLTKINAEMDNLVGDGAETLAKQWIDGVSGDPVHGAALGELRLVTQMGEFLGPRGKQLLTKQRTAIAWRRQKGSKDEDSQRDDEAEARGKAPNLFFASSLPTTTSTPSSIDGIRNASATPSSHPLSFHFTVHQVTAKRCATSQADSPHSVKHFSPFLLSVNSSARSKLSRMSIASLSPPAFDSSRSSDERAYHSLFDALQFNKQSSTLPYNLPFGLGQGESQSHTPAFASPLTNRVLCLPCSTALTSKQKTLWRLPAMPLVSSSVTPSPPPPFFHTPAQVLNSQASSFPSPRSYVMPLSGRRDQLNHVVEHPPMLDLKKIPKRGASSAGFAPPSAKRRITQPNSHTPVPSPTTVTQNIVSSCTSKEQNSHIGQKPQSTSRSAHVSSCLRTLSSNLRVMSSSHPILTVSPSPAPRSSLRLTAEKARRSNAKVTQVQIRRRLMRALPPENISSTVKTKVERLELELAALRARKKANFIVSKQSIYGDGEAPPDSPQRSPSCQHDFPDHQDTVGGILRGRTVVFEGSTMDWEKSREYQEGFRAQRKQGIRYPPLPRLEKSFAENGIACGTCANIVTT